MHPLRIAFVSNTLWSILHFRSRVLEDQLAAGHTVFVLAPDDDSRSKLPRHERLHFAPLHELDAHGTSPLADLRLKKELGAYYREFRPDIVFHYTVKPNIWGTLAAAELSGVRTVAIVTGLGHAFARSGPLQWIVSRLYQRAFDRSSEIWFLNAGDRELFRQKRIIAPERGALLPGEGVDCKAFVPAPLPSPSGEIVFLMVARVKAAKGVREYAAAAMMLMDRHPGKKIRFRLVGRYTRNEPDAIPENEFRSWTDQAIIDYFPPVNDIRPLLAEADVVVLPSKGEGMNMSLMEAAAMGRPLVATDVSGCRELVLPGVSGLLCKTEDAVDLASAMEKLYLMPSEERTTMGIKGRELMLSTYDDPIILSLYRQRIDRLAGKN